jgi:hypothetical protein
VRGPPRRNGNVLHGQLQARNDTAKLTIKTESSRFDALVTRYYVAVYSLASRFTDDPREAVLLTQRAFSSIRKQLWLSRNEIALVSILKAVVRANVRGVAIQ